MSVAEQFIEEGRQEGEWIGKIQMLEQFLGRVSTAKEEFEGHDVKWLEAKFRELEEEYNKKIKGK
jgi:hypothetical protein